jgi:hypothetical protein
MKKILIYSGLLISFVLTLDIITCVLFGRDQIINAIHADNASIYVWKGDSLNIVYCNCYENYEGESNLSFFDVDFTNAKPITEDERSKFHEFFNQNNLKLAVIDKVQYRKKSNDKFPFNELNICYQNKLRIGLSVYHSIVTKAAEKEPFYYVQNSFYVWLFYKWIRVDVDFISGP